MLDVARPRRSSQARSSQSIDIGGANLVLAKGLADSIQAWRYDYAIYRCDGKRMMIKTFRSRGAELLFARKSVALFQAIELAQGVELMVRRKLAQLNAAAELRDLAVPSENCLEPVTRERKSQHSIRISHGWQLGFVCRSQ